MKRFTRFAITAVGVLALFAPGTPPAHATTTVETTFIGTAVVTGGIGYPATTLGAQVPTTTCLPLPGESPPFTNCHPVYDHQRTISAESETLCTDTVTNVTKAGKDANTEGDCSFTASGTITGHCGANGGQLSGEYTDSGNQTYRFNVHFTGVGGEVTITGHITKNSTGRSGKITGLIDAIPATEVGGQSCTNKTQRDFVIGGELTFSIITFI